MGVFDTLCIPEFFSPQKNIFFGRLTCLKTMNSDLQQGPRCLGAALEATPLATVHAEAFAIAAPAVYMRSMTQGKGIL